MVVECSFTYPDGRHCRRVVRRGDTLCPGHRPGRSTGRRAPDAAFGAEIAAHLHSIRALDLESLIVRLPGELRAIHPLVDRTVSRRSRLAFARALVTLDATVCAAERAMAAMAARSLPPPHRSVAALSSGEVRQLCDRIISTFVTPGSSATAGQESADKGSADEDKGLANKKDSRIHR